MLPKFRRLLTDIQEMYIIDLLTDCQEIYHRSSLSGFVSTVTPIFYYRIAKCGALYMYCENSKTVILPTYPLCNHSLIDDCNAKKVLKTCLYIETKVSRPGRFRDNHSVCFPFIDHCDV